MIPLLAAMSLLPTWWDRIAAMFYMLVLPTAIITIAHRPRRHRGQNHPSRKDHHGNN